MKKQDNTPSHKSRSIPRATRQFNMGSTRPQKRNVEHLREAPKGSSKKYIRGILLVCAAILIGLSAYMDGTSKVTIVSSSDGEMSLLVDAASYVETVNSGLAGSLLYKTKLTASTAAIEAQLYSDHPELLRADVRTTLLSPSLIVEVELREPQFVLLVSGGVNSQQENRYLVDAEGYVMAQYTDELREHTKGEQYLAIEDQVTAEVALGERVFSADTVWFIQEVLWQLDNKDIAVEQIVFPVAANDIHVFPAGEDYYVKYDISSDIKRQAGAHIATVRDSGSAKPNEYIDVRVSGRVFIK